MVTQSTTIQREERILAAVREAVILHGVRRTTANDIAERAGVSRMTFYRAMGTVDEAVLLALTREFAAGTAKARTDSTAATARERVIEFALAAVQTFATSPLIQSIRERDPELLLPYLTDRFGRSQLIVLSTLQELIAEGAADGTIQDRPGLASGILLALQGFAISAQIAAERGEWNDCLREIRLMLQAWLATDAGGGARGQG